MMTVKLTKLNTPLGLEHCEEKNAHETDWPMCSWTERQELVSLNHNKKFICRENINKISYNTKLFFFFAGTDVSRRPPPQTFFFFCKVKGSYIKYVWAPEVTLTLGEHGADGWYVISKISLSYQHQLCNTIRMIKICPCKWELQGRHNGRYFVPSIQTKILHHHVPLPHHLRWRHEYLNIWLEAYKQVFLQNELYTVITYFDFKSKTNNLKVIYSQIFL